MSSVNKVILIGRLGKDPEVRYTQTGTAVAALSLATSFKPKDKEAVTEWHRVVAWGRTGEVCGEYLHKGSLAYFEGRLQTRQWEDSDGVKRYTTEIVCERMQILSSNKQNSQSATDHRSHDPVADLPDDIPDDDVPF